MSGRGVLVILLLLTAVVGWLSTFTVDRTEFVYLTRFGRHVATFDGADESQAGLHLKWPWPVESVTRIDRRLQYFDLPGAELLTRDPQRKTIDRTLTLDAYVCWRVADKDGVDRFIRAVGTADGARAILGQQVGSELGAAVGQMRLDELISDKPGQVDAARERLRERLLGRLQASSTEYGIDVVDVRLRRASHPPAVRQEIFNRIISEREKKAAEFESEGNRLAADIRSDSERQVAQIRSEADASAIEVRGKADAEADRIRGDAQARDPQFYSFLKKLEEYQRVLGDNKTMLLLSTHRELFDLLFQPPSPNGNGTK